MSIRSLAKEAIELGLVSSGFASLHRRRMSGRTLILAYHNIVADDRARVGDLSNHLPLSTFALQMRALCETHDVVPLADVLKLPPRGRRPRAVITFDDAYRGAIVNAVPELVRQGMPATIFVTPAFIGGRSFWWDVLAQSGGGGLNPADRDHALVELRGEDVAVREWAARSGRPLTEPPDEWRGVSEAELLAAAGQPGITLGSHTWGHPNLTRLTDAELRDEMEKPLQWLRARVPNPLPWIAYPYGFSNDAAERAAEAAGYEAALLVEGGWTSAPPARRFAVPRLNIPRGVTRRGFALRAAGLLAR